MCLVGALRNESGKNDEYASGNKLHSQTTIRQILKEKMIAYAVTDGAFKQGAANRNTVEHVRDKNTPLATMRMSASDLGI